MNIKLEFEVGKTTCAIKKNKFCRFTRSTKFGQANHCHLFEVSLTEKDGWLQRCDKCKKLEEHSNSE